MKEGLEIIALGCLILGMGKVIGLFDKNFSLQDFNFFAAFPKSDEARIADGVADGLATLY